jgi:3-oxoacyl-[acyl-carrier protein] reductase
MPTTDALLANKRILITGASRGLGACIARTLWRRGASLLMVARSEHGLRDVRADLAPTAADGQTLEVAVADLSAPSAPGDVSAVVDRLWGGIDVLVNNAAILGPLGPAWENDWSEWQATLRVNLLAPVALCRAFIPFMARRRWGKIINLSGGGATGPRPNVSAYATAKAGLVRFTETVAHETRDAGIDVNCVAPGPMNTDMLQAIRDAGPSKGGDAEYAQAVRHEHAGAEVVQRAADLCAFLASSASDGITGRLISAVWDPWERLPDHRNDLQGSDIYTLRRIVPNDRGKNWE